VSRLESRAWWATFWLMALLVAEAWVFFFPGCSGAATLTLWWANPKTNQYEPSCFTQTDSGLVYIPGTTPLTDLRDFIVKLRSFSNPKDSVLTYVPYVPESDSSGIEATVPDGITGDARVWSRDLSGNSSCLSASYVFAFPALYVPPPPPPDTTGLGLKGDYYTYDRWTDFKAFLGTRVDTTVEFNWGAGAAWPTGPADYYSIRWTGTITAPAVGIYTFYVNAKDGRRVWIDGVEIQNYWNDRSDETSGTAGLTAGPHAIKVEYYQGYGNAWCTLLWSGPGIAKQVIPKGALHP